MNIVHLTASTFYGGPERQMLGLSRAMPEEDKTVFLSFREGGRSRAFLSVARHQGFEALALHNDTPRFRSTIAEITGQLERVQADVLFCHGYKANLLGRPAARRCRIPAIAVSRGWTGENLRVRAYEWLDRFHLRWMDQVVCVSEAQAAKVRRTGVQPSRVRVIPNAVDVERFTDPDPVYRNKLARYFRTPRAHIVGAAGRLSPEKGFDVLIEAAERVLRTEREVGFVLFGDGPCRADLAKRITDLGLVGSFVLAGFRPDLDKFLPYLDLLALPSHTEGMPNVVLEAFAAGVPVVATAVGGTPELIEHGVNGLLVPPGDPEALAERLCDALASEDDLRDMGMQGRQTVVERFGFVAQAERYLDLLDELLAVPGMPFAQEPEVSAFAQEPEASATVSGNASLPFAAPAKPAVTVSAHGLARSEDDAPLSAETI